MDQVGLFASGCMLYDVSCLGATDDHLSYASTLSIYVYRRTRGALSSSSSSSSSKEHPGADTEEDDTSAGNAHTLNHDNQHPSPSASDSTDGMSLAHILVGPESTIVGYAMNEFLHVAITVGRSHGIFVWSAETGEPLVWPSVYRQPRRRATTSTVPFATSVFLHDGETFATCVSVWKRSLPVQPSNATSMSSVGAEDGADAAAKRGVCDSPSAPLIFFGGTAGCVSVLHTGTFQCATTQCKDDECFITCCACAPSNRTYDDGGVSFQGLAAVGTSQGSLAIFRASSHANGARVDLEMMLEISDLFDDLRAKKGEGFFDRLMSDSPEVSSIAFDPLSNGQYVIAASRTGLMLMLDVLAKTVVQSFDGCTTRISSIAFLNTPPGMFVTTDGGRSSAVTVWNVSSKQPTSTLRPQPLTKARRCVPVPAALGDRPACFVNFQDGSTALCAMDTGEVLHPYRTPPGHSETIFDCRFSRHDPNIFASCSYDGSIRIWSLKTCQCIARIDTTQQKSSTQSRASDDDDDDEDTDSSSKKKRKQPLGSSGEERSLAVYSLDWSPEVPGSTSARIVGGTLTGEVIVVQCDELESYHVDVRRGGGTSGSGSSGADPRLPRSHSMAAVTLQSSSSVSPSRTTAAAEHLSPLQRRLSVPTAAAANSSGGGNRVLWRKKVTKDVVWRVHWPACASSWVAVASRCGSVVMLSALDGASLWSFRHPEAAFGLDIARRPGVGILLATASHDTRGRVFVFPTHSSQEGPRSANAPPPATVMREPQFPSALLVGHSQKMSSISFNPITTSLLVSTSDDHLVALWYVSDELPTVMSKAGVTPLQVVPMRLLAGHINKTRAVAWCHASPYLLLTGSWDSTIRLWDIRQCVVVATTTAGRDASTTTTTTPSNRKLTMMLTDGLVSCPEGSVSGAASQSRGGISWCSLAVGRAHRADVYALTSHPDRPFVFLSASRDTTMRLWTLRILFSSLHLDAVVAMCSLQSSFATTTSQSTAALESEWGVTEEHVCKEMLTEADASDIVAGECIKKHVLQFAEDGLVNWTASASKSSLVDHIFVSTGGGAAAASSSSSGQRPNVGADGGFCMVSSVALLHSSKRSLMRSLSTSAPFPVLRSSLKRILDSTQQQHSSLPEQIAMFTNFFLPPCGAVDTYSNALFFSPIVAASASSLTSALSAPSFSSGGGGGSRVKGATTPHDPDHVPIFDGASTVIPMSYLVQQEVDDVNAVADRLAKAPTSAVGSSRRELQVLALAERVLRLGDIERYCDLLASIGNQERALAAAPAVSLAFYQSLCIRFAEAEIESVHRRASSSSSSSSSGFGGGNVQRAVELFLFAGQPQRAAALLQQLGRTTDAVIVTQRGRDNTSVNLRGRSASLREMEEDDEPMDDDDEGNRPTVHRESPSRHKRSPVRSRGHSSGHFVLDSNNNNNRSGNHRPSSQVRQFANANARRFIKEQQNPLLAVATCLSAQLTDAAFELLLRDLGVQQGPLALQLTSPGTQLPASGRFGDLFWRMSLQHAALAATHSGRYGTLQRLLQLHSIIDSQTPTVLGNMTALMLSDPHLWSLVYTTRATNDVLVRHQQVFHDFWTSASSFASRNARTSTSPNKRGAPTVSSLLEDQLDLSKRQQTNWIAAALQQGATNSVGGNSFSSSSSGPFLSLTPAFIADVVALCEQSLSHAMETLRFVQEQCIRPLFTTLRAWQLTPTPGPSDDSSATPTTLSEKMESVGAKEEEQEETEGASNAQAKRTIAALLAHVRSLFTARDVLHRTVVWASLDALIGRVVPEPARHQLTNKAHHIRSYLRLFANLIAAALAMLSPFALQLLEITSRADQQLLPIAQQEWDAGILRLCRIATTQCCWMTHWAPPVVPPSTDVDSRSTSSATVSPTNGGGRSSSVIGATPQAVASAALWKELHDRFGTTEDIAAEWRTLGLALHTYGLRYLFATLVAPSIGPATRSSSSTTKSNSPLPQKALLRQTSLSELFKGLTPEVRRMARFVTTTQMMALTPQTNDNNKDDFSALVSHLQRLSKNPNLHNTDAVLTPLQDLELLLQLRQFVLPKLVMGSDLPLLAERSLAASRSSFSTKVSPSSFSAAQQAAGVEGTFSERGVLFLDSAPTTTALQPQAQWLSGPCDVSYAALQHAASSMNYWAPVGVSSSGQPQQQQQQQEFLLYSTLGPKSLHATPASRSFVFSLDETLTCHLSSWFAVNTVCFCRLHSANCIAKLVERQQQIDLFDATRGGGWDADSGLSRPPPPATRPRPPLSATPPSTSGLPLAPSSDGAAAGTHFTRSPIVNQLQAASPPQQPPAGETASTSWIVAATEQTLLQPSSDGRRMWSFL